MLEIPEEIKQIYRSDNISEGTARKFRLRFFNDAADTLYPYETLWPSEDLYPEEHEGEPWLLIENDRIVTETVSIAESLSSSDDMEFGSCESTVFVATVADVAEDVTGKEFALTLEVGGYEMAMGIYTVESFVRQADRRMRKITAYDRMRRFDTDVAGWYNELTFPMTIKKLRDSLCDYLGVRQEDRALLFDDMEIAKTIEPEQISGRDVLQAICQINGCFGHFNKTGYLDYIMLQQTGLYPSEDLWPEETLYPTEFGGDGKPVEWLDYYKSIQYEDYLVDGITGLSIRQEEGDIGANVGTGDNPYAIEGNFLVYGKSAVELLNIAQSLLPHIYGRTYKPAKIECYGMPWVEVGDAVRAQTTDDIVETFVMKRTMSGIQALMDTIEATGSKQREEVFGINKKVIQLEGKAAVIISNVEEISTTLTDFKTETQSKFQQTADEISAEVKRAKDAEAAITVRADGIVADVADFKTEAQSKFQQTADEISLKVSKGTVSSEISAESGQVSIKSNRLVVDSTNFKLDANGNATFSGKLSAATGTFKGELSAATGSFSGNITGGSISIGNVFKVTESGDTSITGDHFTWSATNSSMTSDGTITCKNIKATTGSFSGNITASSISGGNISIGALEVDDSEIWLGDYYVSADNSNIFASNSGEFEMNTSGSGPGGAYAVFTVRTSPGPGSSYSDNQTEITPFGITASDKIKAGYIEGVASDSTTSDGWTIGKYLDWIYGELQNLSDRTVKANIEPIDSEEALSFILAHSPISFQYTTDGKWSVGFIAQDVEKLEDDMEIYYPLTSFDRLTGKYTMKYTNYIPLLVAAVQNLQEQITALKGGAEQ